MMQAGTPRRRARGQYACPTSAILSLNDCVSAVLDATTHLHEQIVALREYRSALKTTLAQLHGARSSEPHPLLVSLGEIDSDEEADLEEDVLADLDVRVGTFSLAETVDESMQLFGDSPSPPPLARCTSTPMLPMGLTAVRWATPHLLRQRRLTTL
jgi:hypothetical protein